MIGSLANAQNVAWRKQLEAGGYKFSLGADGWAVYFDDDVVAEAISRRRGEGCFEDNLDRAVFAAKAHQKQKEASMVKPIIDPPTPARSATPAKMTLQQRAVKAAIEFLEQAGAKYHVEFEGEVLTNMKAPPKPGRVDTSVHWRPLLEAFKDKGSFTAAIEVPEEYDLTSYMASVRMYLMRTYGAGNTITNLDRDKRLIEIVVAKVGD